MANEALSHLFGDYVVQSSWMATEKTSQNLPAAAHALTYTLCFLPVTRNPKALAVIGGTHFVIDRWRLARHAAWAKNQLAPKKFRYPFSRVGTGYPTEQDVTQPWLTFWLMIVADNTMHLAINHWAIRRWNGRRGRA